MIIELKDVCKNYGNESKVRALDNVTLEIQSGETVAITGASGSGKSTLLNLICGLDVPDSGQILFEGIKLSSLNDDEMTKLRREKIGMIFQTFNLLPTLSALENVALTLRLQGLNRRESEKRAFELLEKVSLSHRAAHLPDEMSGGERQRTAIARALVFNPPLLLADEPTGNLDSVTGENILQLLSRLHADFGTTIVLVTHNESAASRCQRILTMRDGRIEQEKSKKIEVNF